MRVFASIILGLALAGCAERVQVVDPVGKPVQGAQVAPVSLSMNGAAETTDAKGEASVALSVGGQETKWVSVSKAGFVSQQVGVTGTWPLKVVLQPVGP